MNYRDDLTQLDRLVNQLPFGLHDGKGVARAYRRYRRGRDRRDLEIWTYCFVRRYFLIRFVRRPVEAAELEEAIEKAYVNIRRGRDAIHSPERYAHWVTVICRNTYLNAVTRRRDLVPVDLVAEPSVPAPRPAEDAMDRLFVVQALSAAIDKLPEYLQPIARLKLVDQVSYAVIGERLDHPVPTVRAYMHKIMSRFRRDPALMAALDAVRTNPGGIA